MRIRLLTVCFIVLGLAMVALAFAPEKAPPPARPEQLVAISAVTSIVAPAVDVEQLVNDSIASARARRAHMRLISDPDPIPTCGLPGQPKCAVERRSDPDPIPTCGLPGQPKCAMGRSRLIRL